MLLSAAFQPDEACLLRGNAAGTGDIHVRQGNSAPNGENIAIIRYYRLFVNQIIGSGLADRTQDRMI